MHVLQPCSGRSYLSRHFPPSNTHTNCMASNNAVGEVISPHPTPHSNCTSSNRAVEKLEHQCFIFLMDSCYQTDLERSTFYNASQMLQK